MKKLFVLSLLFFLACVYLDNVIQPNSVYIGDYFTITINGNFNHPQNLSFRAWLAMMLPLGVRVDSIRYTTSNGYTELLTDTSSVVNNIANSNFPPDSNMIWWGYQTQPYAAMGSGTYVATVYLYVMSTAIPNTYLIDYRTGSSYHNHLLLDSILDQPLTINAAYDVGVKQIVAPAGNVPRQPIAPTMIVKNYGRFNALSFITYFRILNEAGSIVYNQAKTVAFLRSERETTLTYSTWTPETVGNYQAVGIIYWGADQNRRNDTLRQNFSVYWKDVGISQIIQPIGSYTPGTKLLPKCKVKNYGTLEEFNVPVKCSIPTENYFDEVIISYLSPGSEVEVTFTDTLTVNPGSHTVFFKTTTSGDLDPTNDVAQGVYSGGILDVGATAIISPSVGATVQKDTAKKPVSGKVKNFGEVAATFKTFFRIYKGADLLYIDSLLTTNLAPNQEITLTFTPYAWAQDTGVFSMVMRTLLVGDMNSANDSITGTFRVILTPPGWHRKADVSGAAKPVKSGGALVAVGDKVYALVGNNTRDLMVYDIGADTWTKKSEVPISVTGKKKNVKKGAAICADHRGWIYVIKGGNTKEFWRYKPEKDSWKEFTVPFEKGIKGGSMTFDGSRYIYLISGSNNNQWIRFDVTRDTFEACNPATLPADKWKTGSWIVYTPGDTIYGLR
ncbi:MAG: hypothetical protein N2323_06295, partial [candidate division WOR-3 bacterium]|nr:hypothetical protein [candidate division WOR-3 bacterium]